jgi:hypothetical protein
LYKILILADGINQSFGRVDDQKWKLKDSELMEILPNSRNYIPKKKSISAIDHSLNEEIATNEIFETNKNNYLWNSTKENNQENLRKKSQNNLQKINVTSSQPNLNIKSQNHFNAEMNMPNFYNQPKILNNIKIQNIHQYSNHQIFPGMTHLTNQLSNLIDNHTYEYNQDYIYPVPNEEMTGAYQNNYHIYPFCNSGNFQNENYENSSTYHWTPSQSFYNLRNKNYANYPVQFQQCSQFPQNHIANTQTNHELFNFQYNGINKNTIENYNKFKINPNNNFQNYQANFNEKNFPKNNYSNNFINGKNKIPIISRKEIFDQLPLSLEKNHLKTKYLEIENISTKKLNKNNFNKSFYSKNLNFVYMKDEEIFQHIINLSREQSGCRFLQKKIEEDLTFAEKIVFPAIWDSLLDLMIDAFGNYLIQKLLEYANDEILEEIILIVNENILNLGFNAHGTRIIQKIIEVINNKRLFELFLETFSFHILDLFKDVNGNHIIIKFVSIIKAPANNILYVTILENILEISTNKHACCALQKCIDYANEDQKKSLIELIIANTIILMSDQYGNYVLQYIIMLNNFTVNHHIACHFRGNISFLSKQKFSSNVIEKCFDHCDENTKYMIVKEISSSKVIVDLLLDMYGNYGKSY